MPLDRWYLLEKLRLTCAALNNQFVVDLDSRPDMIAEIDAFFLRVPHLHSPLIQVLYQVMRLFERPESPDNAAYAQLKSLLEEHAAAIPVTELGVIYTYVQNHCIRQIKRGESRYLRELFDIYCRLLEHGLLLENGQLSPGISKTS